MAKDPRSRQARKADPERWYQVVEMVQTVSEVKMEDVVKLVQSEKKVDIEPHQLHVQGPIDDVIVLSLPKELGPRAKEILTAFKHVLADSGVVGKEIVVIPREVKFMKLRPVGREKDKQLTRQKELRKIGEVHASTKRKNDVS